MLVKKLRRSRTAVVGVCCALAGAAIVPVISLAGSITGSTGDGPMVFQSGEVYPTYEGLSNVSSVTAGNPQLWSRVGDTVHVEGTMTLTPTSGSTTLTRVYIPVPIDSNINGNGNCNGVAAVNSGAIVAGDVGGSQTTGHTHQCLLEYNAVSTSTNYVHYTLTYRVKD